MHNVCVLLSAHLLVSRFKHTCALPIRAPSCQVSIVFGGLFVNESNVPGPLKCLPAASLVKQVRSGRLASVQLAHWLCCYMLAYLAA